MDWPEGQGLAVGHRYLSRNVAGVVTRPGRALSVTINSYEIEAETGFATYAEPATLSNLVGIVHLVESLKNIRGMAGGMMACSRSVPSISNQKPHQLPPCLYGFSL